MKINAVHPAGSLKEKFCICIYGGQGLWVKSTSFNIIRKYLYLRHEPFSDISRR